MKIDKNEKRFFKVWGLFILFISIVLFQVSVIILGHYQEIIFPTEVLNLFRRPPFFDATPMGMRSFAIIIAFLFSFLALAAYPVRDDESESKEGSND